MNQTEARALARRLNETRPGSPFVATTRDAYHGRWETSHEWIVADPYGWVIANDPAATGPLVTVTIPGLAWERVTMESDWPNEVPGRRDRLHRGHVSRRAGHGTRHAITLPLADMADLAHYFATYAAVRDTLTGEERAIDGPAMRACGKAADTIADRLVNENADLTDLEHDSRYRYQSNPANA